MSARNLVIATLTLLLLLPLAGGLERGVADDGEAAAAPKAADPIAVVTGWKSYGKADGLPSEKVFAVCPDGDVVWVGTDRGLARLKDGAFTVFTEKDGLAYPVVSSLARCEETGDIWIGTFGGLSRYSGGRFDSFDQMESGLINDVVHAVTVIDGDVWAATAAGLSVYHPKEKTWELFDHENTVMHEPWCYSLTSSADRIYVGVWGGGVVEHDPERRTWKAYRDPDKELEIDLFRDDGLVSDVISGVSLDEGVLWAATYFGLSRYDGRLWRTYLEHDTPLPSNFINVAVARGRWVWLGTDAGMAVTDGRDWVVYRREQGEGAPGARIHREGREPTDVDTGGLPAHDYVLSIAFQEDRVWVGTAAGLSVGTFSEEGTGDTPKSAPVQQH